MAPRPDTVYHIATVTDWERAAAEGRYAGGDLCRAQGFIHFSARDQLADTLHRFFRGRTDLVLLSAPVAALGERLRWEEVPGAGTFPHYYGTLATDRLRFLGMIAVGRDGRHILPAEPGR